MLTITPTSATLILLILTFPLHVDACNCVQRFPEQATKASVIFEGVISEIIDSTTYYCSNRKGGSTVDSSIDRFYIFDVRFIFKGPVEKHPIILGGYGGGDCGIAGFVGEEMIILAREVIADDPSYYTSYEYIPKSLVSTNCDGAGLLTYFRKEEIDYLNVTFGKTYSHPASREQIIEYGLTLTFFGLVMTGFAAVVNSTFKRR